VGIDRAAVDHVARLARLSLTEEERALFTAQLGQILEYFARLSELELGASAPTSHIMSAPAALREDVVRPSLDRDEVLAAAPDAEEGFFKVPPVLEPA